MAENPVIRRFGAATGANRNVPTPSAGDLQNMYDQPTYAGPRPGQRWMTLDDVVQRTGAMLLVILAAGAVAWTTLPDSAAGPALIFSMIGGLGLGLYICFSGKANAATCMIYSAFEGVLLGTISHFFEQRYPGIVVQALTGTIMVALGILFVYKIGAIRVTPRFTRIVIGATLGAFGLMVVNLVASIFVDGGLGLRDGNHPALAIGFSLLCIVLAAMNLVLDFDMVQQGIRNGADQKMAWYASFGITVTLVWLYIEILRLLGYMRN